MIRSAFLDCRFLGIKYIQSHNTAHLPLLHLHTSGTPLEIHRSCGIILHEGALTSVILLGDGRKEKA